MQSTSLQVYYNHNTCLLYTSDIQSYLPYIIGAVAIILLPLIVTIGYVKAPPDTAYIMSGLRKKIIIGKASIRIPFLKRLDKLSLKLI